jgi:hypothetical protein
LAYIQNLKKNCRRKRKKENNNETDVQQKVEEEIIFKKKKNLNQITRFFGQFMKKTLYTKQRFGLFAHNNFSFLDNFENMLKKRYTWIWFLNQQNIALLFGW